MCCRDHILEGESHTLEQKDFIGALPSECRIKKNFRELKSDMVFVYQALLQREEKVTCLRQTGFGGIANNSGSRNRAAVKLPGRGCCVANREDAGSVLDPLTVKYGCSG